MPTTSYPPVIARPQLGLTGLGLIAENYHDGFYGGGLLTGTGIVYVQSVGLRAGDVISNVYCKVTTNGATLTNGQAGIATVSGTTYTIVAVSTDQKALFTAGTTPRIQPVPVAYTVPADGMYYLFVEFTQTAGTMPSLARYAAPANSVQIGSNPFRWGATAGKTTLAVNDTGTVVADNSVIWMGAG